MPGIALSSKPRWSAALALLAVLHVVLLLGGPTHDLPPQGPSVGPIETRVNSDSYNLTDRQFFLRYGNPSRVMTGPLSKEDQTRFPAEISDDLLELFSDQDELWCYVRTDRTELIGFKNGKCDRILGIASPIATFR